MVNLLAAYVVAEQGGLLVPFLQKAIFPVPLVGRSPSITSSCVSLPLSHVLSFQFLRWFSSEFDNTVMAKQSEV